jgi:hypothetical protein
MVGDHLYLSRTAESCTAQLLATALAEKCAVSAVQATHERATKGAGGRIARQVRGERRI